LVLSWYKTNAIDFSRLQIAIDVFLFSDKYTDVATLSVLAKYSAGTTYYYPSYHAPRDGIKFEKELHHNLTRATAFEAVMRVRATRGLRFSNFFGNYFVRGTDLLALPVCTSDSSFSLDIAYDEAMLSAQAITIQAALLYTSSAGERRIRVHTMVLPVTTSLPEMVDSLDIDSAMNLLSKQACDIACKTGFENARSRVNQTTVDILKSARGASGGHLMGAPGQHYGQQQVQQSNMPIPNSLLLLPLYSMSLQKSLVLRGGQDVRVDERAYFQQLLYNMDIEESKVFIYPRMFSLHDMATDIGLPSDNADDGVPTAGPFQVRLPSIMNLSYERLTSDGIFLMENGYDMFMWVCRNVNPAIVSTLFGLQTLEGCDVSQLAIQPENSDYSSRVNAVIVALRDDRSRYMQLHFIREGDGYAEAYFARYLIEDR
jgi:protein transport protein SEC24